MNKKIDLHVHYIGMGNGSEASVGKDQDKKILTSLFRLYLKRYHVDRSLPDGEYADLVNTFLHDSSLDQCVLLAMDHRYKGKEPDRVNSPLYIPNDLVLNASKKYPDILAGVSINPSRPDSIDELERCAEEGAALVKWIPSSQDFDPSLNTHKKFYQKLAELKLPILSHGGTEHALLSTEQDYNNPARLKPALDQGVTVIVAHCAASGLTNLEAHYKHFLDMAKKYNHCYGDISSIQKNAKLKDLMQRIPEKLLYGSDFPVPPLSPMYSPSLLPRIITGITASNPLERHFKNMKRRGVLDQIFSRASGLLKK